MVGDVVEGLLEIKGEEGGVIALGRVKMEVVVELKKSVLGREVRAKAEHVRGIGLRAL